jgi:hypothetical protein
MAFEASIQNRIIVNQTDSSNPTVAGTLVSTVNYYQTLIQGSGTDSGNLVYSVSGTLSSGNSVSYNLQSITRTSFNGTLTATFTNVKAIEIVNFGSGTADILLVGSGSTPFAPWGYASGTSIVERIEPLSSFSKVNKRYGWTPTASSRSINVKNLSSSGVYYQLLVVGCSG